MPGALPVAPGGVIEGRVVREGVSGTVPVPGLQLILKHRKSGEVRTIRTFSDGDFYLIGVKPGDYELSADPAALNRLGLAGGPISFTMLPFAEGGTVDGLELRLR